jgi:hypothetical protein
VLFHFSNIEYAQNKAHYDNDRKEYLDANTGWHPFTAHGKKDREDHGFHEGAKHQQRTRKEEAQELSSPQQQCGQEQSGEEESYI